MAIEAKTQVFSLNN